MSLIFVENAVPGSLCFEGGRARRNAVDLHAALRAQARHGRIEQGETIETASCQLYVVTVFGRLATTRSNFPASSAVSSGSIVETLLSFSQELSSARSHLRPCPHAPLERPPTLHLRFQTRHTRWTIDPKPPPWRARPGFDFDPPPPNDLLLLHLVPCHMTAALEEDTEVLVRITIRRLS